MDGDMFDAGGTDGSFPPFSRRPYPQIYESTQGYVYTGIGSRSMANRRQYERRTVYPVALGIATAIVFTILSCLPKGEDSQQYAFEEARPGLPVIDHTVSQDVPSVEQKQGRQAMDGHGRRKQGNKDKARYSPVKNASSSPPRAQLPLKDSWGLPMLDEFERSLPPSVKQGKERIAEFIAKTLAEKESNDQPKEDEELRLVAKAISDGSSHSLTGMIIRLNNIKPLHMADRPHSPDRLLRINKVLGKGASCVVVEVEDTDTHEVFGMRIPRQHKKFSAPFRNYDSFVSAVQNELDYHEEAARQLCGLIPADMASTKKGISVPLYTANISGAPDAVRVGEYCVLGRVQLMERLSGDVGNLRMNAPDVFEGAREYIARRLLQAVLKFQQAGFSHNDLKWDNLLLRSDGSFVIADLGSALPFGRPYRAMTLMTPRFREPHLALHDAADNGMTIPQASSDLWSTGILLYELFTKKRYPYGRYTSEQQKDPEGALASWILGNNIRSSQILPELEAANVPEVWKRLILRLLEPRRSERITGWEIVEEFPELVKLPE